MTRPAARIAASALLFLAAGLAVRPAAADPPPEGLVVHEWGTFTTVAGSDGAALDWRPLAGPDDLPPFVYGLRDLASGRGLRPEAPAADRPFLKVQTRGTVRMETPVLYFYADREMEVSVKVDFPKGKVTEWYPRARAASGGIDWGQVRLMPGSRPALPTLEGKSHYYAARETDAVPIRVCLPGQDPEFEKFLFYRGVGTFDLPLRATLEGGRVRVRNEGTDPVPALFLFENDGRERRFQAAPRLEGEAVLERGKGESGADALEKALVAQGLFEKEARAMVKTWEDSWFEPGLRLFYLVPERQTDEILPLSISPKPAKVVRVLVGRIEILTPETEARMEGLVRDLGHDDYETRERATADLRRSGRFAEPLLRRAAEKTGDREVKARAEALLDEAGFWEEPAAAAPTPVSLPAAQKPRFATPLP